MANDFYTHDASQISRGGLARATSVNTRFQAVETGLDKLPNEANIKRGKITYGTDTGAANAYVVTTTYTMVLAEGQEVHFKAVAANTGASTINVNALGAVAIKRQDGTDVASGDIPAGGMITLRHNGTNWRLITMPEGIATSAAASATAAAASETAAAASAAAAATAKTNAETAETNAETAEVAAEAAQTAAETAKTAAETAETNAATSATNAATSATTATTQATTATTQATNAATSATNAATSETNAATSATNAATSETNAATSATTATTQASAASTSATNAATSETNAATSATNAATSATNAATSETNAATSATTAENAARSVAFRWNFDSATAMADPGTGDLRLNNATIASATAIAIDDLAGDTGNPDVSTYVLAWDDSTTTALRGTLIIRKVSAPQNFAVFNITGASTDNVGWTELAVTYVIGSGTFANTDALTVQFVRTGNQGTGDVVGPATATADAIALFSGTGGKTIKDSTYTITAAGAAILDDASATAQRTTLGLAIGTDVQAYDATLASLAALGTAADRLAYTTGIDTWAEAAITAAGRAILDDATAAVQATTLGLGTGDSPQFTAVNVGHATDTTITRTGAGDIAVEGNAVYRAGGTDVPLTDGGTGASTAEDAFNAIAAMDATPAADHTANGPTTNTFAAAGSITVMDLVYLDGSSQWAQTDADAAATAGPVKLAISLETKTVGQAMKVALPGSFVRDDTWAWTPGAVLYVSETAGAISASVPTGVDGIVRVVGHAVTADVIFFNPSDDYVTIDASGTIKNVTGIAPAAASSGAVVAYRNSEASNVALATQASGGSQISGNMSVTLAAGDVIRLTIPQIRITELNVAAGALGIGINVNSVTYWATHNTNATVEYMPYWLVAQNQFEETKSGFIVGSGGVPYPMVFEFDVTALSIATGAQTLNVYAADNVQGQTGELQVTGATTATVTLVEVITP